MPDMNEEVTEWIDEEVIEEIEAADGFDHEKDASDANITLGILNEKIGSLWAAAKAQLAAGDRDTDKIEPLFDDVVRYLYDVYMDDTAYVCVPYFRRMREMLMDKNRPAFIVYTLPEEWLPETDYPEMYKKELFRDIVDLVNKNSERFRLFLNPGTDYAFEVADENLAYIMARKSGSICG